MPFVALSNRRADQENLDCVSRAQLDGTNKSNNAPIMHAQTRDASGWLDSSPPALLDRLFPLAMGISNHSDEPTNVSVGLLAKRMSEEKASDLPTNDDYIQ